MVRKLLCSSRLVTGSMLLLGSHLGCIPDLDGLTTGADTEGGSGAGKGGTRPQSTDEGGATGGEAGKAASTGGTRGDGSNTSGTSAGGKAGAGGSSAGSGTGAGSNAGNGGSGVAGEGGNVGAGGGAAGGGAGAGGAGGHGGGCGMNNVTATGVEMLTVPLASVDEGQRYNVQNRTNPSMPYNLSGSTVTIRAYAPCAIGGNLSVFFRSSTGAESAATKVALSTLNAGFVAISVPVPPFAGNFNPFSVDVIRVEVEADSAYGSTFQSPATIVYIDSIASSNGVVAQGFGALPSVSDFSASGSRTLEGASHGWYAKYP